jgi:hypothetical protein
MEDHWPLATLATRGRSQKVQPMAEKEEWHESGGVRIVEGPKSMGWESFGPVAVWFTQPKWGVNMI